MTRPKVFFYVQHLLGIGHLVRANRIATALHERGFDVLIASGGMPVEGFPGPGPRLVQLPPLRSGRNGFSDLEDSYGNAIDDQFKKARCELLLDSMAGFAPDILIVEAFPFGRRAMRFELIPLLEAAKERKNRPLIVCSIRDILQETHKPGRAEETAWTLERFFDLVLVHGDPKFAKLGDTFPLANSLSCKVVHTGLVAGGIPPPADQHYDILVSAGGGAVGAGLLESVMQVARQSTRDLRWCIITGPNAPFSLSAGSMLPGVDIVKFRADLPSLLFTAQLSISQAGYNTVCDVLRAGCRMLLIPFTAGGETEQAVRSERLKQMGLANWLPETALNVSTLSAAVDEALAEPLPPRHGLDLEGARHTADILYRHLGTLKSAP